jgi:ribosomal protein L14
MIQLGTILKVIDNSPVREIRCIKVLRGDVATQGDIIIGTVYRLNSEGTQKENSKVNKKSQKDNTVVALTKGDIVSAVVVRTKKPTERSKGIGRGCQFKTGIQLRFPNENAAILIVYTKKTNTVDPVASRSKGPISPIIASKGYTKLLALGSNIILFLNLLLIQTILIEIYTIIIIVS